MAFSSVDSADALPVAAQSAASWPLVSWVVTSAPDLISRSTMGLRPDSAAIIKGVSPLGAGALTIALFASSRRAISICPLDAA
ncbi:hypothetical protein D3C85_1108350 [compost metagenome]